MVEKHPKNIPWWKPRATKFTLYFLGWMAFLRLTGPWVRSQPPYVGKAIVVFLLLGALFAIPVYAVLARKEPDA